MTKRNTNADRIASLEATLATLTTTMSALAQHIQGTPVQPQAVAPTPAPTPAPTAPTAPTWAQPGRQATPTPAPAINVRTRPAAPPLPQRPTGVVSTTAPAPITTPAAAHSHSADDKCFLGCRTMRGHQSRPSTGLIEVASGAYWHKGEGDGTRTDPRPGALTAHASNGTQWQAVCDANGQVGMVSAQDIAEALKAMRNSDGEGNRGAPAILVGEEPINGWRLSPAPFRRATLAEKMASDESAYRRLMAMAAEATEARKRLGR